MTTQDSQSDAKIDIGTPYTPKKPTPVVSVSINHPLAQAAKKVKNFLTHKQTLFSTTFNIKVTPIVAIVSLFGIAALFGGGVTTAFTLGKTVQEKIMAALPSPTPSAKQNMTLPALIILSKAGTIKATYLFQNTQNTQSIGNSDNQIVGRSDISGSPISPSIPEATTTQSITPPTPNPTPQAILHYILVSRSGSINYLQSSSVQLKNYLNLRVLITGEFNSSTNTLTVNKTSDIEILQ